MISFIPDPFLNGKFKISFMASEHAWSNRQLSIHVAPPLTFTVTSFLVMPTNSFAPPSVNIRCNMWNSRKQNVTILFQYHYILSQLFIRGDCQYLFPKCWNWQSCQTYQEFKLLFHTVKPWILFRLNLTVYFSILAVNSTWFTSRKGAAKAANLWKYWHMLPYMVHDCTNEFETCSKHLAEWLQVLQTGSITSSIGYTRWEQRECFCKEQ